MAWAEDQPPGAPGRIDGGRDFGRSAAHAPARSPAAAPPFSARRGPMCLDRRRIQQQRRGRPAGRGPPQEHAFPDTFARPADEPIVQRLVDGP